MSFLIDRCSYQTHAPILATLVAAFMFHSLTAFADDSPAAPLDDSQHAHEHPHDLHGDTETIVVTASPLEHDRDEVSVPIDRIERDELLDNLGATIGETLSHLPGLATSGFAAGASRPIIRGQDAYRTEVLEDGLRTQDVSRESPDHAVPVNPLAAQRIEVVRGPATLRYGGGASAGAVNVITNRVPDQLSGEGLRGEVFGGIGLVANERDLAASLDGEKGDFAFHADGVMRRSNDYSIPNDDRPHTQNGSEVEAWMGSLGGAYIGEAGRLGASYVRAENVYGIPEDGENVEINMVTDRYRVEGDLFEPVQGIRDIRFRGVYSNYEHDERAGGTVGQSYENDELDARLEIIHDEFAGFSGAVGGHFQYRKFKAGGEAAEFLSPTKTTTGAVYFYEERSLTDLFDLEAGFRIEHVRVDGVDINGLSRDLRFTPMSGSIGLVTNPADWLTIGMGASVSQRAPSQVELLARGPHEATATFERGDSTLDEETSYTGEIRIELTPERGRIEWAGFVTQYDDYIFAGATGGIVNEDGDPVGMGDDPLTELAYGNRDALFWGFEVAGEYDVYELDLGGMSGTIGLDGRFDLVRARFDSRSAGGTQNLPRITPIRWGAGIFFKGDATDARIGFVRTEAQDRNDAFETSTDSFTYLNASLSHEFHFGDESDIPLNLSIVARNLADVRGRNHLSFTKDEVILPGRSIRFGARVRF